MSKNKGSRKGMIRLSSHKDALATLRGCYLRGYTDYQTQAFLEKKFGYKWSIDTVRRNRRKHDIENTNKKKKDEAAAGNDFPPPGLSNQQRAAWYRDKFKQGHFYTRLIDQFTQEEIKMYLEEYGKICCQFEDIVFSESCQIDDFLKHRILIDRQLAQMQTYRRQIDHLNAWIESHPPDDKSVQDQRAEAEKKVMELHRLLSEANSRYDKLSAERQKMGQGLAATRRDRIQELRSSKSTFLSLITKLQTSREFRDEQGTYAELSRLAAEDVKKEYTRPTKFPDGSIDQCIIDPEEQVLMDDEL